MIEEVVENFTKSFFVGVIKVSFFEMGGQRKNKIVFNTDEDMKESIHRAKDRYIGDLFMMNPKDKTWLGNRDNYETAIYMTAVAGAADAWCQEFERKVKEERDGEDEADKNDDD